MSTKHIRTVIASSTVMVFIFFMFTSCFFVHAYWIISYAPFRDTSFFNIVTTTWCFSVLVCSLIIRIADWRFISPLEIFTSPSNWKRLYWSEIILVLVWSVSIKAYWGNNVGEKGSKIIPFIRIWPGLHNSNREVRKLNLRTREHNHQWMNKRKDICRTAVRIVKGKNKIEEPLLMQNGWGYASKTRNSIKLKVEELQNNLNEASFPIRIASKRNEKAFYSYSRTAEVFST